MLKAHDSAQFEDACHQEIEGLYDIGVFIKATITDARVKQAIDECTVIDTMLVGKRKRDENHTVCGHKGRCVIMRDAWRPVPRQFCGRKRTCFPGIHVYLKTSDYSTYMNIGNIALRKAIVVCAVHTLYRTR